MLSYSNEPTGRDILSCEKGLQSFQAYHIGLSLFQTALQLSPSHDAESKKLELDFWPTRRARARNKVGYFTRLDRASEREAYDT